MSRLRMLQGLMTTAVPGDGISVMKWASPKRHSTAVAA